MDAIFDRRQLLRGAGIGVAGAGLAAWLPAWAQTVSPGLTAPLPTVAGDDITLRIARQTMTIDGRVMSAIGLNGTVPGPIVRLREGQTARLHVVNDLDEESSLHWHGLLFPAAMDGVPGMSFPASSRARPSQPSSRCGRAAPTGITAIPASRSSSATMGRSSSTPPAPIRSATIAST